MARDKKTMIGFDPLAWLDEENPQSKQPEETQGSQPAVATGKTAKKASKSSAKATVKSIDLLGHSLDENALLKGFDLAADVLDEVVENFYAELFEKYAELQPLFAHTNTQQQGQKLQAAIKLLIENIHNQDTLETALLDLGERHKRYGALPEHYPIVAELLESNLKKKVGRSWTRAVSAAWLELLTAAAEVMCRPCEVAQQQAGDEDRIAADVIGSEVENNQVESAQQEVEAAATAEEKPVMQDNQPLLHLHSVQDISKSQALKNEILALVNDNDAISIDASEVERIDGTALQLLCALFQYARDNSMSLSWIEPSDSLIQSAEILGVKQMLELSA